MNTTVPLICQHLEGQVRSKPIQKILEKTGGGGGERRQGEAMVARTCFEIRCCLQHLLNGCSKSSVVLPFIKQCQYMHKACST